MYILFWVRILFLCILCFTLTRSTIYICVFSVIQLFPTLWPYGLQPIWVNKLLFSVSTIFAISFFSPPLFRTPFSYIFSEASEDKICYHLWQSYWAWNPLRTYCVHPNFIEHDYMYLFYLWLAALGLVISCPK